MCAIIKGINMSEDLAKKAYDLLAKDIPTEADFKTLLQYVSYGVLAKRYLSMGLPFVFKDQPQKLLAFREAVGRIFDVLPQNIAIMGSGRFGFSTNPHKHDDGKPKKLDENSDIDLVVVSAEWFARELSRFSSYTFGLLRDHPKLKSDAKSGAETVDVNKEDMLSLRNRSKALSLGYVNPSDLDAEARQEYYDLMKDIGTQLVGTSPPGPIHRCTARIYRDWQAAERSYEYSFKQLAKSWGLGFADEAISLPDEPEAAVAKPVSK